MGVGVSSWGPRSRIRGACLDETRVALWAVENEATRGRSGTENPKNLNPPVQDFWGGSSLHHRGKKERKFRGEIKIEAAS